MYWKVLENLKEEEDRPLIHIKHSHSRLAKKYDDRDREKWAGDRLTVRERQKRNTETETEIERLLGIHGHAERKYFLFVFLGKLTFCGYFIALRTTRQTVKFPLMADRMIYIYIKKKNICCIVWPKDSSMGHIWMGTCDGANTIRWHVLGPYNAAWGIWRHLQLTN